MGQMFHLRSVLWILWQTVKKIGGQRHEAALVRALNIEASGRCARKVALGREGKRYNSVVTESPMNFQL